MYISKKELLIDNKPSKIMIKKYAYNRLNNYKLSCNP